VKQVVVITGVAGGIGSGAAKTFSDAGWHVVGIDRRRVDAIPGVHHLLIGDMADIAVSERIFAEVTNEEGRIDALVNNAGILICKSLIETTPEEWEALMACNLRSVHLAVRNAYPLMRAKGGAIINVSSVHAVATSANVAAYAASKGALLALTRALAIELAPDHIRVNAVLPGAIDTGMLRAGLSRGHLSGGSIEDRLDALASRHVIGRVGQPEEIGQAILFLADNERSSFVTGQSVIVDGGATARLSTE